MPQQSSLNMFPKSLSLNSELLCWPYTLVQFASDWPRSSWSSSSVSGGVNQFTPPLHTCVNQFFSALCPGNLLITSRTVLWPWAIWPVAFMFENNRNNAHETQRYLHPGLEDLSGLYECDIGCKCRKCCIKSKPRYVKIQFAFSFSIGSVKSSLTTKQLSAL